MSMFSDISCQQVSSNIRSQHSKQEQITSLDKLVGSVEVSNVYALDLLIEWKTGL